MTVKQPTVADDRLIALINAHCDQRLSKAEAAELRGMLLAKERNLDLFLSHMELHGELLFATGHHDMPLLPLDVAAAATGTSAHVIQSQRGEANGQSAASLEDRPRRRVAWVISIAAALLLCIGASVWLLFSGGIFGSLNPPIATIAASYHANWQGSQQGLNAGDSIILDRGLLELNTDSGALMILEGPAQLDLTADGSWQLQGGRLYVDLQNAESIVINTPYGDVRDLGTQFGIYVTATQATVQVYQGNVVVEGASYPKGFGIGASEAFRFTDNRPPQLLPFSANRFARSIPQTNNTITEPSHGRLNTNTATSISAPRANWPISIDGNLQQWQPGAALVRTADPPLADRHLLTAWLQYDANYLYIAARVADPNGMRSKIDPHVTPRLAAAGGSLQWHFAPNDQTNVAPVTLTMWYFADTESACLSIEQSASDSVVVNPAGFEGVCRRDPNSPDSYLLEYRIPWQLLNAAGTSPASGDAWKARCVVTFSDESGRHEIGRIEELVGPSPSAGIVPQPKAWGEVRFGQPW